MWKVQCSIDGLLDRTIKHMMYLRSMTDQAEKLKSYAHPDQEVCKVPSCVCDFIQKKKISFRMNFPELFLIFQKLFLTAF